ncbi:MAG: histidinol-phosphate transaminase [Balneolaceae bacterium]|nr:histidinol-phosphate transaminase [Balneolaceae bacterium]
MNSNFDIKKLVRPNILDLMPYRSARDDFDSGILLDANENAYGAPFENDLELHRYPMPYQEKLRDLIADFRGVDAANIFTGVGSDEAIDLLFRIFCEPGSDEVLITPPTYGMYKVSAAINNVAVNQVLLTPDFQLHVDETLQAVSDRTKIIFLCSPNNPTGNSLNREDMIAVVEQFNGIVVVDEAYIDFSVAESFATLVNEYPNLVVLQTMSKAFGLAGIRLGIAIANPAIIEFMMKVKAPYNVNKLTSQAAIRGYSNIQAMKQNVAELLTERDRVIEELSAINEIEHIYPTDANFLIFRVKEALSVYKKLAEAGVIVRFRGNEPHCENCLRLTIGTTIENNTFLEALRNVFQSD